jgi:putative oxidoreductase
LWQERLVLASGNGLEVGTPKLCGADVTDAQPHIGLPVTVAGCRVAVPGIPDQLPRRTLIDEGMGTMTTTTSDAFTRSTGGALASFAPAAHALLRIGAGLLYMQHGAQKLFGMFGGMGPNGGTVHLVSQMGLAGVLEFFGGLLTRPVALLLACEMVVAYVMAHLPQGGFPIQNKGELALLYLVVWLFLATNGAGPASLDARRR